MKVLILSPTEICHSPRLLKAADYLHANGVSVTVYNGITGLADRQVYASIKNSRRWKIIENDISKRSVVARFRWLYSALVSKFSAQLFKRNIFIGRLIPHALNKGYVLFPNSLNSLKFDFILIHLVDSLPFAAILKRKTGASLIYDSQEYFKGQYANESKLEKKWVEYAEKNYAFEANIILATTNAMLERIKSEFSGDGHFLRVRNVPLQRKYLVERNDHECLRIVWHGLDIVPNNIRGVHILLEAVANCTTAVELYLQGNILEHNRIQLEKMLVELNIQERVFILDLAHPDRIVESLTGYDIGVAGELGSQDNQRLTSSNKLFDYINAGLAVVVPDLPGLAETVNEYRVGCLYQQGNVADLAKNIDLLNKNRGLLAEYKNSSRRAASLELFWEHEYKAVLDTMYERQRDRSKYHLDAASAQH